VSAISIDTDKPIAHDSPDHIPPHGTAQNNYLARFGALELNITPTEVPALGWPESVTLEEFRRRFPAEFAGHNGWFYSDIFVRTTWRDRGADGRRS
jgi:hypothetical protein